MAFINLGPERNPVRLSDWNVAQIAPLKTIFSHTIFSQTELGPLWNVFWY